MNISFIFGTRPEVIKLARVIKAFENIGGITINVCFTGQHREMVLPLIGFFDLRIDHNLDIMQPNQTLAGLSSRSLSAIDQYLELTSIMRAEVNPEPASTILEGFSSLIMDSRTRASLYP